MKQILIFLITIACLTSCGASKKTSRKIVTKKIITKKTNTQTSSSPRQTSPRSSTPPKSSSTSSHSSSSRSSSKANKIIDYAKKYQGVKYKWGGTSKSGMDCSGLTYVSFKANDIILPRSSSALSKEGSKLSLKNVKKGDLLFFKTNKKKNAITHVGLIVDVKGNNIEFIHATTSRGVIISKLSENYWHNAFAEARRVL